MSDIPVQSVEQSPEDRAKALKATYAHLSFIHQKLLTTQFYLEELSQADAAMKFVQEMANKIVDEINQLEPQKSENTEASKDEAASV